jgi:hypothetical protein
MSRLTPTPEKASASVCGSLNKRKVFFMLILNDNSRGHDFTHMQIECQFKFF